MDSVPLNAFLPVPRALRSYVYVVVDYNAGKFKVGHAVRPRDRFLRMIRDRPDGNMHLVAVAAVLTSTGSTKKAESLEAEMHRRLRPYKNGHGDWFLMSALGEAKNMIAATGASIPPADVLSEAMQPFGNRPKEAMT